LQKGKSRVKFAVTFRFIESSNATETKIMRKNFLRISILAIAILVALLALGSWRSASNGPCEESMDQCCKKKNKGSETNIWESGTGQFFTSTELN
jgi:hypothetical protein